MNFSETTLAAGLRADRCILSPSADLYGKAIMTDFVLAKDARFPPNLLRDSCRITPCGTAAHATLSDGKNEEGEGP